MVNSRNNRSHSTRHQAGAPQHRGHAKRGGSAKPRPTSAQRVSQHARAASAPRPAFRLPLIIASLLALGILAGVGTTSCLSHNTSNDDAPAKEARTAYVSPYDFSGLAYQNGYLTYSENGVLKSQVGVDVSEHQGSIDWQAVANDGIQFAMLRIGNRGTTEGGLFQDGSFDENLSEAQAAGLQVGAYFYSQATSVAEAQEEADFVVGLMNGRKLDLPIVFDHEQDTTTNARGNTVDRETLTAAALAFCQRIEDSGYRSMVYGNKIDIARLNLSSLGDRPVWFAEYNAAQPSGQFDFAIWQYTNNGTVDGISTPVDLNLRFTDAI